LYLAEYSSSASDTLLNVWDNICLAFAQKLTGLRSLIVGATSLSAMSTAPFKVKAIYEYSSPHDDDLSFPNGQVITVTEEEDNDWYTGTFVDPTGKKQEGLFPRNFVEKYEPEIPSRPTRPTRGKKETEAPVPAPEAQTTQDRSAISGVTARERKISPERFIEVTSTRLGSSAGPPSIQPPVQQPSSTTATRSTEQPPAKPASKNIPAEASDKPSGGSFKDRIAAFNKPAAPPVAPFKPGGQGTGSSTGFIKKPFVAPPPSKNAYVPPLREAPPAKAYRREEDPGFNETADDSEASMPLPGEKPEAADENQSKPTSLKDRIALLQKQQLEQAARHAEAAQKKEKAKRPPKKRTESQEPVETLEGQAEADPEGRDRYAAVGKKSVDFADDESEPLEAQGGHQRSHLAHLSTPPPPSRELMSDTNDADNSAGGDTEEAYDTSTSREDNRERLKQAQATTKDNEPVSAAVEAEESDEEVEEDQDVDPEIKRRMEIRERMAKMSGGMGLMGMFGPSGGMPTSGKKVRASGDAERDVSGAQGQPEAMERAPPVLVPGMFNAKSPEQNPTQAEGDSSADEDMKPTSAQQRRAEAEESDEEIIEPSGQPQRTSLDRAPPIVAQGMETSN
jgi:myosin tail region-interacting protein MTI1